MPLNLAEIGKSYVIHHIGGLEKQKHHLESIGFVQGMHVQLLSKLHGYFIVRINDTKIGLEKSLAQKVILLDA